ncbi:hypothetical protein J6590_018720 [Homalodisca vitripennis]|nr:hypothetical protein J6590_018720 [Homalodisca vitripennis]
MSTQGPSSSVSTTPKGKSTTIVTIISPEKIRPFPKAERTKLTSKGRKPEKEINPAFCNDDMKKAIAIKRKKNDSTSDDSLASFLSERSIIGIQDLIERYEMEWRRKKK